MKRKRARHTLRVDVDALPIDILRDAFSEAIRSAWDLTDAELVRVLRRLADAIEVDGAEHARARPTTS